VNDMVQSFMSAATDVKVALEKYQKLADENLKPAN
jgi:hypothetical protein